MRDCKQDNYMALWFQHELSLVDYFECVGFVWCVFLCLWVREMGNVILIPQYMDPRGNLLRRSDILWKIIWRNRKQKESWREGEVGAQTASSSHRSGHGGLYASPFLEQQERNKKHTTAAQIQSVGELGYPDWDDSALAWGGVFNRTITLWKELTSSCPRCAFAKLRDVQQSWIYR